MLNQFLTIAIPSKNESINIYNCLKLICEQKFVDGVQIIIADSSDSEDSLYWLNKSIEDFHHKIKINIIEGGFPAKARLEASRYVKTPFILFLDADIMLKENDVLIESYKNIFACEKDLLTVPFKTEFGWNWSFKIFFLFQKIGLFFGIPFAIGGFQFWKTNVYWKTGGYVETQKFAEDYWISSKCDPKKFILLEKNGVWTSARRFRKKGITHMVWLMFKSYLNRDNPEFFNDDHNYWR